MARSSKDLEDMSFAELTKMEQRLEKLKAAEARRGARRSQREGNRLRQTARLPDQRAIRPWQEGQRQRGDQISRPEQSSEHVDWPGPHASLDGGGNKGWEGQEGGFCDLSQSPFTPTNLPAWASRFHLDGIIVPVRGFL